MKAVNEARLAQLEPTQTIVKRCQWKDLEAEADEMWSFVGSKQQQRWLWHAIDHHTGEVLGMYGRIIRTVPFLNSKPYWSRLELCSSIGMAGALMLA